MISAHSLIAQDVQRPQIIKNKTVDGYRIVAPSIENLINMLEMSSEMFENEMRGHLYSIKVTDRSITAEVDAFKHLLSGHPYNIFAKSRNRKSVIYSSLLKGENQQAQDLLNNEVNLLQIKLEPYLFADEGNRKVYLYTYNNNIYAVYIYKEDTESMTIAIASD